MYNVLLVDDDQFVLDSLKNEINWAQYNMKITAACANGKQALEILEKQKIDVVLTDIRMSPMDGLELAKAALKKKPELYIVIMSGYSEFEYARTALKLGVFDYLLKPVTLDTLETLFSRLADEMSVRFTAQPEKSVQWKLTMEQKYFQDLLNGVIPEHPPASVTEQRLYYQTAFFHIDHYKSMERSQQRELISSLFAQTYQWGIAEHPFVPVVVRDFNLILVFRMQQTTQEAEVRGKLRALQQRLNKQFGITLTIGVSEIYTDILSTREHSEKARYASHQKHLYRDGEIIYYTEVSTHMPVDHALLRQKKRILWESLNAWNFEKAVEALEQLERALSCSSVWNLEEVQMLCVEINSMLQTAQNERFTLKEEEHQFYEKTRVSLYKGETLDELFTLLKSAMKHAFLDNSFVCGKNSKIITQVVNYIQDNVNTNITLSKIAGDVYLSPNYLGYLFKEQMGMTFNEYVLQYRMELAKKLLKSHKYKVYEVSAMVGYKKPNYFSKVFTDYMGGICPSEYENRG